MKSEAIDFENEKVSVLFRKLLIPTLLGTISLSAVTAIDGIFIGHGVGAIGVAAVNIVVPVFQIMAGLGLMVGVGCSVVASIHIARQNMKTARQNVSHALGLTSALVLLLCLAILLFPKLTSRLLGASDTLMPNVLDYLTWIVPGFVFQMWSMIGLFIIRLDGSPRYAMWCNIVPAFLNAFLDWLFIFPLDIGLKGAAIATTLSIIVGGVMAMSYLVFFAENLRPTAIGLTSEWLRSAVRNLRHQCKIGSSTLLGELTLAVLIYIGNIVFMKYLGDAGVGAFGIACYYMPFFFMVGNAIAQSAQPIISYNYGAGRWAEIREARRLLFATSIFIGAIVAVLFVAIPDSLVALFVDVDSEAGRIAVGGFPYFASGIIFFILNVATIGYYQSVEQIKKAMMFVFLRGFILLIPAFLLLPQLLGERGIWLSMPAAELGTTMMIVVSLCRAVIARRKVAE